MYTQYKVLGEELNHMVRDFINKYSDGLIKDLKPITIDELKDIMVYSSVARPCFHINLDVLEHFEAHDWELIMYGDNDNLVVNICYDPDDKTTYVNIRWQ